MTKTRRVLDIFVTSHMWFLDVTTPTNKDDTVFFSDENGWEYECRQSAIQIWRWREVEDDD